MQEKTRQSERDCFNFLAPDSRSWSLDAHRIFFATLWALPWPCSAVIHMCTQVQQMYTSQS